MSDPSREDVRRIADAIVADPLVAAEILARMVESGFVNQERVIAIFRDYIITIRDWTDATHAAEASEALQRLEYFCGAIAARRALSKTDITIFMGLAASLFPEPASLAVTYLASRTFASRFRDMVTLGLRRTLPQTLPK